LFGDRDEPPDTGLGIYGSDSDNRNKRFEPLKIVWIERTEARAMGMGSGCNQEIHNPGSRLSSDGNYLSCDLTVAVRDGGVDW